MTNEQKYKTAEERDAAYKRFCESHEQCSKCKLNSNHRDASCRFLWLAAEYKEPKQDLPFEIRANSENQSKLFPFALFSTVEYGRLSDKFIVGLPENYYHDELCDRLNAAALAWHKQMVEKERK